MENRNYFSLHCVQMETQLIHANLENLYTALNAMANEEARAHSEVRSRCPPQSIWVVSNHTLYDWCTIGDITRFPLDRTFLRMSS